MSKRKDVGLDLSMRLIACEIDGTERNKDDSESFKAISTNIIQKKVQSIKKLLPNITTGQNHSLALEEASKEIAELALQKVNDKRLGIVNFPRIKKVICEDDHNIIAEPNFPRREEGFIHGPDIMASVIALAEEKFGEIKSIKGIRFKSPVKQNQAIQLSTAPHFIDINKNNLSCYGEILSPIGVVQFGLINNSNDLAPNPITQEKAAINPIISVKNVGINSENLPFSTIYVNMPKGIPNHLISLFILENLLVSGHVLIDRMPQIRGLNLRLFTKVTRLNLKNIKGEEDLEIESTVKNIEFRGNFISLKINYVIKAHNNDQKILSSGELWGALPLEEFHHLQKPISKN